MGKGRGPAECCCGACSCGICCAVFILLAGVVTLRKCDEKGRLKVKMKGHLKQRRANSGEAKKKTRVISQWENVNCDEVFP